MTKKKGRARASRKLRSLFKAAGFKLSLPQSQQLLRTGGAGYRVDEICKIVDEDVTGEFLFGGLTAFYWGEGPYDFDESFTPGVCSKIPGILKEFGLD